jgi:predicted nuclease of predicted toxin-antitoxin system
VHSAIKFYLDENIQTAVAAGLLMRGVDALTVQEAGRRGVSDLEQLQFALDEGRVLVTFDPDYLAIVATGLEHAGIAWCRSTKHTVGELINSLLCVHAVLTPEEMRNHIEYL